MKQNSACEIVSHTLQLTQKIRSLRHKLLKDYEGKSTHRERFEAEEAPLLQLQKLAKLTDDARKLRQELLSSQMLNSSHENTIRKLKIQVKMKEQENMLQEEKQVKCASEKCSAWKLNYFA